MLSLPQLWKGTASQAAEETPVTACFGKGTTSVVPVSPFTGRALHCRIAAARRGATRGRVRGNAAMAELVAPGRAGRPEFWAEPEETQARGAGVRLAQTHGRTKCR